MESMQEATEKFLKGSDLREVDAPYVTSLRHAAAELDNKYTAALASEYRLLVERLSRKDAGLEEKKSDLAAFLEGVKSGGT